MKKIALFACGLAAVMFCSCGKKQAEEAPVEEMDSIEVEVLDTIAEADTLVEEIVEEVVEVAKPAAKTTTKKATTKPTVEVKKDEELPHGAIKVQAGNTEATIAPGRPVTVQKTNEELNTSNKVTVTAGGKKAALKAAQTNE